MSEPIPENSTGSPDDMVEDEVKTFRQRVAKPAAIGGVAIAVGATVLAVVAFVVRKFRNR